MRDIEYSDALKSLHLQLEAAGQLTHPLTEAEMAELRNIKILTPWR